LEFVTVFNRGAMKKTIFMLIKPVTVRTDGTGIELSKSRKMILIKWGEYHEEDHTWAVVTILF
jgi:hypothetical protein